LIQLFEAAGWPSILLIVASVVGLAIILERSVQLRSSRVNPPRWLDQLMDEVRRQGVTPGLMERLQKGGPLLGVILAAGLKNRHHSRDTMKEAVEEAGRAVVLELERNLSLLGTIAVISPLLGLFGTVVGMILLFGSDGPAGTNPQQLAHGISVALYNTAFGLVVAVPATLFYRLFHARVDVMVVEMEQQAIKWVDVVQGERQA
jgi:biopolymer transport protein ExbB